MYAVAVSAVVVARHATTARMARTTPTIVTEPAMMRLRPNMWSLWAQRRPNMLQSLWAQRQRAGEGGPNSMSPQERSDSRAGEGLEPSTTCLQDRCATDCATPAGHRRGRWHDPHSTGAGSEPGRARELRTWPATRHRRTRSTARRARCRGRLADELRHPGSGRFGSSRPRTSEPPRRRGWVDVARGDGQRRRHRSDPGHPGLDG